MNTLPISDYPASSDDRSQMQVLSERRGEIAETMQKVGDSRLDPRSKGAVTEELQSESADLSRQIHNKKIHSDDTKHIDDERQKQELSRQKELSKRQDDAEKGRLDVRA